LRGHHLREIFHTIAAIPSDRLLFAMVLTALSSLLLALYDVLSLRLMRRKIPYQKTGFASFISYAFSNNLGLSALTGGSVRLRFYRDSGLSAKDIVRMTAYSALTFWLGFLALAGTVFLFVP